VRFFEEQGFELMVTQSYSKNFGLYGERIGALNIVCKDKETSVKVRCLLSRVPIGDCELVEQEGGGFLKKKWFYPWSRKRVVSGTQNGFARAEIGCCTVLLSGKQE